MHAVEESSTNDGYLVNDQQDDDFPLLLETQIRSPCTHRGPDIPLGMLYMQ